MFFLFPRLEHPAGWICARYKSVIIIIIMIIIITGVGLNNSVI